MAGKERDVAFRSKVPSLIGEVQQKTNRYITPPELIRETGLERKTVYKWLAEGAVIKYLDGATVRAFRQFFSRELNRRVLIDELAEEVDATPEED